MTGQRMLPMAPNFAFAHTKWRQVPPAQLRLPRVTSIAYLTSSPSFLWLFVLPITLLLKTPLVHNHHEIFYNLNKYNNLSSCDDALRFFSMKSWQILHMPACTTPRLYHQLWLLLEGCKLCSSRSRLRLSLCMQIRNIWQSTTSKKKNRNHNCKPMATEPWPVNLYNKLHSLPVTKTPKEFVAHHKPSTNPIVVLNLKILTLVRNAYPQNMNFLRNY
jgi:hypothetical protein